MAMPEIKPEVNKEPERDKKKAGLLARLLGGGSGSGSGAAGFGSVAASGGILATKAGLLALIVAGTTVAGGIGVLGYRLFGPGQQDQSSGGGDNLQLFAPKPKEAAPTSQAVAKDGSSESLSDLAKANSAALAPVSASGGAPQDSVAAGAAGAATSAGTDGAINKPNASGNGVSALLKNTAKFGALSTGSGSGSGAPVANVAGAKSAAGDASSSSRGGTLSGAKAGAARAGGTARAFGQTSNGAVGQAFSARQDGQTAATNANGTGSGRTFDGGSAIGSGIGAGAAAGIGGVGTGAGAAADKTLPNTANPKNSITAPPTPPAQEEAPWQNAITAAQGLLLVGGLILFAMSKLKGTANLTLFHVLNAVVGVIAAAIIALGAQIATGQYGQKLQGGVLAAAGAGLMVAAVMAYMSPPGAATSTTPASGAPAATTTTTTTTADAAADVGKSVLPNMYVLVGGGAALLGIAGTMMAPATKYPASDFNNSAPPDFHFGYQELPSEAALKKMVA